MPAVTINSEISKLNAMVMYCPARRVFIATYSLFIRNTATGRTTRPAICLMTNLLLRKLRIVSYTTGANLRLCTLFFLKPVTSFSYSNCLLAILKNSGFAARYANARHTALVPSTISQPQRAFIVIRELRIWLVPPTIIRFTRSSGLTIFAKS